MSGRGDLIESLASMAQSMKMGVGVYIYPDGERVNLTVKRGNTRSDLLYSAQQIADGVPTPDTFVVARVMKMCSDVLAKEKEAQP